MGQLHQFLVELYGENAPGYLALWGRNDKQTRWIEARHLASAEHIATGINRTQDVYFGAGLQPHALGKYKRGSASTVSAIPGFWFDVDYADESHKELRLPWSAQAVKWINRLDVQPTVVVSSGHGCHLWWLFDELLVFEDEWHRQNVQRHFVQFSANLRQKAQCKGWYFDSVHDLARVMRLPGTLNHKNPENLVRSALLRDDGPRYSFDALVEGIDV